jgi:hypothetical protein
MGTVHASLGMSLNGFVARPNAGPNNPLGDGGCGSTAGSTTSRASASVRASKAARPTPTTRSPRRRTPGPGPS